MAKQFKIGDIVYCVTGPDDEDQFYNVEELVVRKVGRMEDHWPGKAGVGLWFEEPDLNDDLDLPVNTSNIFHVKKEAMQDAIQKNEALQSELALVIGRLKDELAKESA